MLRDAWFLARNELVYMLSRRETLVWTFAMPILFFYFIGTITRGFSGGGGSGEPDTIGVRVPVGAGFLADHLIRRLEARNYRVSRVASDQELAQHGRRLAIPAGFTEAVLAGRPVQIDFTRRGGGPGSDYDQFRIARAVYSVLADFIVAAKDGATVREGDLQRLAAQPRSLTLRVESGGKLKRIPSGFDQAVPGAMVMFTLLVMFTSGGILLVIERNQGLLRRLASSPMTRGAVVLGKWGSRMALGIIQISFAMLTGTILFGVRWGPHLATLLAVLFAYAALAASLGMLLGNFARTEGQVIGLGVMGSNVMAALGGCWWPIEITPAWTQKLALLLPTGWAMDALHKLVSFGADPASVAPHLVGMSVTALAAGTLIARRFRFQ